MADVFPPQEPLPPENTPTPFPPPASNVPPPPVGVFDAPAPRKTNWWLIVLIVLLLLCCCCAAFTVFMYQVGGDWLINTFNLNEFIR